MRWKTQQILTVDDMYLKAFEFDDQSIRDTWSSTLGNYDYGSDNTRPIEAAELFVTEVRDDKVEWIPIETISHLDYSDVKTLVKYIFLK